MKYKYLILKMVLAMSNEEYVFKIYHYILAKYRKEEHPEEMMELYKAELIKMLDKLSEKSLKRLYQLTEYLYIHEKNGEREAVPNDSITSQMRCVSKNKM